MKHLIHFISFFSILFLVQLQAEEQALRIVHQKGQVTSLSPQDQFPQLCEEGMEYTGAYKLFSPDFSELVLKHKEIIELNLAGLTNLEFTEDQDQKRTLVLSKGHVLLSLRNENTKTHLFKVPYGQIEWTQGTALIQVGIDNSALVYAEKNSLALLHRRGQKKTLKEGDAIIIDRFGFKELKQLDSKVRVIFDFSRDEEKEKMVMDGAPKKSEELEQESQQKSEVTSATVKGKVAEDAKIVEGEASGEGEYKWDLGPNLLFFLIPILVFAGIIAFFKFRKSKPKDTSKEEKNKEKDDENYEAEDAYVIRGNLTSNDGKLVTTKTTHILGDVEDGAEIEASHKLLIKGSFQGAKLVSTHNVNIQGGINGMSKANIQLNGDLKTTYISEANILCLGTVKVDQAIRNSKVAAEGLIKVEKKDIIGGEVASKSSIECETLGSDFGETNLLLGQDPFEIWKETFALDAFIEPFKDSEETQALNTKASVRVFSEVTNTKITLGTHKIDQKKVLPGPVESHYELSDGGKLTFRGFRRGE